MARRHKAVLEQQLAELLAQGGIADATDAAREIWLLSEGAISSMLVHNDRRYASAAGRAALTLLRARGFANASGRRATAAPPTA